MLLSLLLAVSVSAAPALEVSVGEGPFLKTAAVHPLAGQRVRLRVSVPPGATVRWSQVVRDVGNMYKNANFPWDPEPYKWVGVGAVPSEREPLTRFAGMREVEIFAAGGGGEPWTDAPKSRLFSSEYYNPRVGTFWFEAEVVDGRRTERAAVRVSVRDGPGYLGWLSSYFNVPAVFGSLTWQATGYHGVDCADALSAAWGKHSGRELDRNLNVAALVAGLPRVAEFDWTEGGADKAVRWGSEVRPGDFAAVRYPGARMFQHVGALVSDEDGDGLLSPADRVLHAGPMPLAYARLGSAPFHGRVLVLRPEPRIVERPISFSPARLKATADYIKERYGEDRPDGRIAPRMVVLHWTGSDSLESDFKTFDRETLPQGRGDIAGAGALNVSAHFLVGKDGRILRLMPEEVMARHVIGLNLSAVGIENVGGVGDRPTLTRAQAEANAWLVRDLKDRYPSIEYLIGHHEYRRFEGSPLWKEKDPAYRTAKSDPGDAFMKDVRARVADLGLKDAP